MSVLLVGAPGDGRTRVATALREHGRTVIEADTAEAAEDLLQQGPITLVLCATRLSDSDGFALCERLRGLEHLASVPRVLFSTSPTGHTERQRGLHVGADAVLELGGDPAAVIAAINAAAPPRTQTHEQVRLTARRLEIQQRMLGSVAHEFNNVLAAMLTCAGALADLAEKQRDASELLAELESGAERAQIVAKRLVALARGRVDAPRPVVLGAFVRDLPPAIRAALPVGVLVRYVAAEGEDVVITVSASSLFELLFHLLNALIGGEEQATGELTLSVATHEQLARTPASVGTLEPGRYGVVWIRVAPRPGQPALNTTDPLLVRGLSALGGALVVADEPDGGQHAKLFLPR